MQSNAVAEYGLDPDQQSALNLVYLLGWNSQNSPFMLADRVPRRGLGQFATLLAADFDDGVTTRPIRITSGPSLAVVELLLSSPPEYPQHCPPALTMVHLHDGRRTHRILTHYAA
jgi:hypothetical protein